MNLSCSLVSLATRPLFLAALSVEFFPSLPLCCRFSANGLVQNLMSLMSMIVLLITLHMISRLTHLFIICCTTQMNIQLYLQQLTDFVGGWSLLS
ncbi:hypothetical protein BD769DRAFT_1456030 [Suillus cothurnatus]|nr:hypothetical protein BD769DRAFT_1456030 [Suillus cothurnatus]